MVVVGVVNGAPDGVIFGVVGGPFTFATSESDWPPVPKYPSVHLHSGPVIDRV